jgi:hypothetical protein
MPYKTDKMSLGSPFFDRRTKLIPCQKLKVRWFYEQGDISMRKLAIIFLVSPSLIRTIVQPGYAEKQKLWLKNRSGDKRYYIRGKHAEQVRLHRHYKNLMLRELNPDL